MKDYLGQKPAHTEVAVNITPSPLSCGSHHLTALTWDLRQNTYRKIAKRENPTKGENWTLWSSYLRMRAWNTTPVPHGSPFELRACIPNTLADLLWEEGHTWPQNRPRSWYYVPYSQPGTSSIPELLRPEWCGAKGRIWSERPGLRSLALLLTLLVCGQITVPLWLRFFTCKMETIISISKLVRTK